MKKIAVILGILAILMLAIAGAGCTSQINSVAQVVDPVIGSWESTLGSTYLDLDYDGKGTKTILGITTDISWTKSGTDAYIIDDIRYSLNGSTLEGPIATYHKL